MTERRPFCADLARENGEPLGATASRIDHWFLIEYRGLWTHDAVAGSGLSDQVKDRLREQVRAVSNGRLLFVRRPDRRRAETLVAFTADSRAGNERLRRFDLESHESLREVDLLDEDGGARRASALPHLHAGKHDPCCARYGRPLYEGLRDEAEGDWVWQTTHISGDRFAGNLVCLPEGVYYGRADRIDAAGILDEHLGGRVSLDLYRGRSIYPFAVQAAERAVREETGLTGIHDVVLRRAEQDGESWPGHVARLRDGARGRCPRRARRPDVLTCTAPAVKRPVRYVATTRRG